MKRKKLYKERKTSKKKKSKKAQRKDEKEKEKEKEQEETHMDVQLPPLVEEPEENKNDDDNTAYKKRTRKKRGRADRIDENEEMVDWGWDFVTGDDEGQVILWSGREFKEKKVIEAHDFIWWLEVQRSNMVMLRDD